MNPTYIPTHEEFRRHVTGAGDGFLLLDRTVRDEEEKSTRNVGK